MADKRGLSNTTGNLNRRSYLKLGASGIAGASLMGGTAAADDGYDRVVNIVEAGADNTGSEPIDAVFDRYERDNTLIEFPDGEYVVDQLNLYGRSNFGMRAIGDDVTLIPNRQVEFWIAGWNTRNLRFEGFTLDTTADGIHPTVGFGAHTGLVVRNITKRGIHDGNNKGFGFAVLDENGWGLIENLDASDGSHKYETGTKNMGGAVGVYVDTSGPLTFRDCHIEHWGDNGLYASFSDGPVQVEGGTYKNNDVTQVRLGSAGSYVRNAEVGVDDVRNFVVNARGVRVSDGPIGGGYVTIEDCDITMEDGQGYGAIASDYGGGAFKVLDTRIHVGSGYGHPSGGASRCGRAIYAAAQRSDNADNVVIRNTSITGDASDNDAILFESRSGVEIEGLCISQPNGSRSGIDIHGGLRNVVHDSSINVGGESISGSIRQFAIAETASCPVPSSGGSSGASHPAQPSSGSAPGAYDLASAQTFRNEYPVVGTSASNPTLRLYGNLLDTDTQAFFREHVHGLADLINDGAFNVEFRQTSIGPERYYNGLTISRRLRIADLAYGVWNTEARNYWKFVEYVATNPPSNTELDSYDGARDYLRDAGVQMYGWIPAKVNDGRHRDMVHRSNLRLLDDGVTGLPQLVWNGRNLNALSSGLAEYLNNRL